MGTVTTAPRTEITAGLPRAELARRLTWWSLGLFVALRGLVVLAADTPTITPDELGAWAIAKQLVGAAPMSMQGTPRYSLLSGVVLAPVQALGLGGAAAYRVALVLMGLLVVAAAAVTRRAVDLLRPGRPELAAAAWALVLLFPATLATSAFTWAEPVVTLWWALLLWGVVASFVSPQRGAMALTGIVAATAPFVHGRFVAVPLLWIGAVLADAVLQRRRRTRPDASDTAGTAGTGTGAAPTGGHLVAVVVTVVVAGATAVIDRAVARAVWQDGVVDVEFPPEPLQPGWWFGALTSGAGRLWYVIAASAGLAVLGGVGLWHTVRRPGPSRLRLAALTLAAMALGNLAVATAQGAGLLADLDWFGPFGGLRWDHVVYGRYVDGVALVLSVLGLLVAAELVGRRRGTVLLGVAGATMAAAAVVVVLRVQDVTLWPSIDVMIAGVSWLPFGTDELAMGPWTIAVLAGIGAAAVGLRRSWTTFVVVLAVWFGAAAVLGTLETAQSQRTTSQPDLVRSLGAAPEPSSTAVVARDVLEQPQWVLGVYAQQRDLTDAGWQVRLDEADSAALAGRLAGAVAGTDTSTDTSTDAAAVLLRGDEPAGPDWSPVAEFGDAVLWRWDRPAP